MESGIVRFRCSDSVNISECYPVQLGDVKLYVQSYRFSQDKNLDFEICISRMRFIPAASMEVPDANPYAQLTDNGFYPIFLQLKGVTLKSECPHPGISFHKVVENYGNTSSFTFNLNGISVSSARIKDFKTKTDADSQYIKCEMELWCNIAGLKETEE